MQIFKNSLLRHTFLFGALVGGALILAAFVVYLKDLSVNFDPNLRSINLFLIVSGIFFGVKKYRDDELGGAISYGKALATGVLIIGFASMFYSIFIYVLTSFFDTAIIKEAIIFLEKGLHEMGYQQKDIDLLMGIYKNITPGLFAFGQWFSKALSGLLFSLILAFFFRQNRNLFNKNSIDKFNESNNQ
ncbi:DUF4199 family protein [Labilibaculum sp. A4]|uniref:DUF4199 family protein n=1 Tax=Labilibaculum euxinus TaxID=2686357 RepID=A0A425YH33_9BACT|nr:DUF4199 domain-containing protein [Labilibaculum euxinus]MDQ1769543.1 DUF4199 domain-containing protein [Labilibaculum euxinus]MUP36312.1 DUF4199 family protein [Labilibaculum euxinus]MVB05517.1 DUF4199 family protein [Labilibaculum euxinus]MWN75068.1 DUF4199 family protein [Labilibaculum euxinus]